MYFFIMDWKEIAVTMLLPLVKTVATEQVKEVLDKVDAKEGDEDFAADLQAGWNLFKRLKSAAEDSKTQIDDTVVAVFMDAIQQKASEVNVTLS